MDKLSRVSLIFFGTSDFAVPALKKLAADSNCEIAAVITQPDKPAGRKQTLAPSPVKLAAEQLGLKIFQPSKLDIGHWKLEIPEVDLYIVASYGKIIPSEILNMPRLGALNIHPSLLPKYRGPSPIQTAILNGDKETAVTIMKLDEEMDHGPIIENRKWKIESGIKYKKLHDQLADMGAELLIKILPDYMAGKIKPVPQDHSKASFTKIITKDYARIDWQKSAEEIERMIRAYESWPVAWTTLDGKRLKIHEARVHNPPPARLASESVAGRQPSLTLREGVPPLKIRGGEGELLTLGKILLVKCGHEALEIITLQLEGAKKISAREFGNGYKGLTRTIVCI